MGRRPILNTEIQTRIVEALSGGNYLDTAAHYAGIAPSTLYNWLDRGRRELSRQQNDHEPREDEQIYVDFLESVEKARSRAEVQSVALIRKAAMEGTWQAAAWFLERSYPRKWGRMDRHEVTGAEGGAIQLQAVSASALEEKVLKILESVEPAELDGSVEDAVVVEEPSGE